MTHHYSPEFKAIELWLRSQVEPLGDTDRAELNRQIAENAHLRERFIQLGQEQVWLMWHGGEAQASDAPPRPAATERNAMPAAPADSGRKALRSAPFMALAGLLAIVLLSVLVTSRDSAQKPGPAQDTTVNPPLQGSVLRVASGSATLMLPKVGRVVLEGPAELEMLDGMHARLKQGRIRVRVDETTGHGFVVEYPSGKVTDLGTEFGLDVPPPGSSQENTSLVVFDGAVDLERAGGGAAPALGVGTAQRLLVGEGVMFRPDGELGRIMSIVTGNVPTFQSRRDSRTRLADAVIVDIEDNLRTSDTRKFYEIVPGGLKEDALAYVDRPGHEWNGLSKEGLPIYLAGADYVKTFCDDKMREDMEIRITLSRPAKLYVLYDDQLTPPNWLQKGFQNTGDGIGRDLGPWPTIGKPVERGVGAGNSIDHRFQVWERVVQKPGIIRLGANGRKDLKGKTSNRPHMYGIAAVALDAPRPAANANEKPGEKTSRVEAAPRDAL